MKNDPLYDLKYPIGEFTTPKTITPETIEGWISDLKTFPEKLKAITNGLTEEELNYKYRPNGWTVKQVIHHCADSHINSIIRFKLALTENSPTIKPYLENSWAKLNDYSAPIQSSLNILTGIHEKLGIILSKLTDEQLKRKFTHPEHVKTFTIEETIGTYAWHSNHHLAHVQQALNFKGKYN